MKKLIQIFSVGVILFSAQVYAQGKDRTRSKPKEEIPAPEFGIPNKPCSASQEGTREGFLAEVVSGDAKCLKGIQICKDGQWVGPLLFADCANNTKNCGSTLHGEAVEGYLHESVPKGSECTKGFKTCLNGDWIGPKIFSNCTEGK